MLKFNNILYLFIILSLSGCFAGRKNKETSETPKTIREMLNTSRNDRGESTPFDWTNFYDQEETDFRITKLSAEPLTDADSVESETGQVEYLEFAFSAQLEARGNAQMLIGHKFRVSGFHGEEVFYLEVQENNILRWTETIEFDPQRPKYDPVLVMKAIHGTGAIKGTSHATYELNPWAVLNPNLGQPFRNLTYSTAELNKRHSDYDPSFNYVRFLQTPGGDAPQLNISSASFYINRESTQVITEAISTESDLTFRPIDYPAHLLNETPQEFRMDDYDAFKAQNRNEYDRGNLYNVDTNRELVLRDALEAQTPEEEKEKPLGVRLNLSANITLESIVSNSGKSLNFNAINQGKFRVHAAIVGSNQGLYSELGEEQRILLAVNTAPVVAEVEDKMLNVEFNMVTNHITNRGDLDLAIKVVPLKKWAEAGLKPFGVVYKIGDYSSLNGFSGSHRDSIKFDDNYSYDDYLNEIHKFTDDNKKWFKDNGYLAEAQDIIFGPMSIRFRTVKAGETATQRTVIFDVSTCPTDGISGAKVKQGRQFKILVSGNDPLTGAAFSRRPLGEIRNNPNETEVTVQDTGCMSWVDEMAHKYYQRENLVDRSYHIVDAVSGEEINTLTGYFNPWDEKFGTLGVDSRNLSESFIQEVRNRQKLPSRFFVGDFSYMTLRFRYDIDANMNLTVKKTVLMNIYPFVKRYSNIINGINGNFPIRDGVYLLKIAYQKDYIDPGADGVTLQRAETGQRTRVYVEDGNNGYSQHEEPFVRDDLRRKTMIHTSKKLVRVENNRVITPVEFHIKELRTLRVRSNLLLQLEPVNQYKLQIVNLFERHIADKLGLAIGNLEKLHCMAPGYREALLEVFQDTIDRIALSIPDDINYNSKESFDNVINMPEIKDALKNLTAGGLLEGISRNLNLALSEEQVDRAFRMISAGELAELTSPESHRDLLNQKTQESLMQKEGEDEVLGLYDEIARSAAYALGKENATDIMLAPTNENDDNTQVTPQYREELNRLEAQGQNVESPLGVDQDQLINQLERFAQEKEEETNTIEVDESTEQFLDEITQDAELERLLINDFTIDPAIARVSDLDYLIDRKAGIVRRTFVGPLTLLALDNKNVMNATDALDYDSASNDEAAEQDVVNTYGDDYNSDYARNSNFGYQGHFKNCHVDDFIIKEEHERLLKDAWTECVTEKYTDPNTNEVEIPIDAYCDYEDTEVYREYMSKQTWRGEESSPFRRYERLPVEQGLAGNGQCPYREAWLKKYFSQETAKVAKEQFGNFLAHPSITAKMVTPHRTDVDHTPHVMPVEAVREECIRNNRIGEGCFDTTDRFNMPAENLAKDLVEYSKGKFFRTPDPEVLARSDYREILEEFYNKNPKASLKTGSTNTVELSKDIYKALVNIAAPDVTDDMYDKYEDKMKQVAPDDFGVAVQQFMCNIMLPKAIKVFDQWMDGGRYGEKYWFQRTVARERFVSTLNECNEYAAGNSVEEPLPFHIERKFRTLDTGRYFFRGGKSINFTINQQVGVNHSLNAANKYTLDPINSVKGAITNLLPDMIKEPVRAFTGAVKFHDYSQAETNGISDGKGLGTSAHLSMQAAELDLEIKEYRRCMLVRWNEDFLNYVLPEGQSGLTNEEMNEIYPEDADRNIRSSDDRQLVLSEARMELFKDYRFELSQIISALGNIFICGEKENDPVAIREKFYYVTQHFIEGDLLDSGSLLNNPWLLTLRGYRDMIAFVTALYPESQYDLGASDIDMAVLELIKDDYNRLTSNRPVFVPVQLRQKAERNTIETELEAWQIMSTAYRNVSPTFAGLYTQLSNREASLPDWPWTQEGQLAEREDRSCPVELEDNEQIEGEE